MEKLLQIGVPYGVLGFEIVETERGVSISGNGLSFFVPHERYENLKAGGVFELELIEASKSIRVFRNQYHPKSLFVGYSSTNHR